MSAAPLRHLRPVPPAPAPEPADPHAALIVAHLDYIEKQCRRVVGQRGGSGSVFRPGWSDAGADGENSVQELLNEVLDRLREDDYAALRRFQGKAKLTTYITTIIANLVVDLGRSRFGRSRARERARELGPLAEQLYELVGSRGYGLDAACDHLAAQAGYRGGREELAQLLRQIRGREYGREAVASQQTWPPRGETVAGDEGCEIVVRDAAPDPEADLGERQRSGRVATALQAVLQGLDGEERLLVAWRYPQQEEVEAKSVAEIATLLGTTAKAVDSRLRRILQRCREELLRHGLSRDDLPAS